VDDRPVEQRSPSPDAKYNVHGTRKNARHLRVRDQLKERKENIIQKLVATCPSYRPPNDWRPAKKTRKLYIPAQEAPGRNFVGLLIGPRGRTQQELEQRTGAKITIRCAAASSPQNLLHYLFLCADVPCDRQKLGGYSIQWIALMAFRTLLIVCRVRIAELTTLVRVADPTT
jgi:hypothetical protein